MRLTQFSIAVACLVSSACIQAQSISERAERDEITHMSREEPAMRRAFEKARSTLDIFFKEAASPRAGTSNYSIKVAVSDGKNTEYFWVNRFEGNGTVYSGHLGNEPRMVKKYKFGERFQFDRDQIVDWTYLDEANRRMFGNFTACALLSKEPPAQAEEFKKRYGLVCE